jgi:hypothetical protein
MGLPSGDEEDMQARSSASVTLRRERLVWTPGTMA